MHLRISATHCCSKTTGTTISVALVGRRPLESIVRPAADAAGVKGFARMSAIISTVLPRPI